MKINLTGCTRIVLEFNNYVLKVPNFLYQWDHFLLGIIANINENKTFKYNDEFAYLLCPVVWCSFGGFFLIMRRSRVLTFDEFIEADISTHIKHFKGDDKPSNYGFLYGKLVKIDYGQIE